MAQHEAKSVYLGECLMIAISLTILIIFYESSWLNTVFFPSLNPSIENLESIESEI